MSKNANTSRKRQHAAVTPPRSAGKIMKDKFENSKGKVANGDYDLNLKKSKTTYKIAKIEKPFTRSKAVITVNKSSSNKHEQRHQKQMEKGKILPKIVVKDKIPRSSLQVNSSDKTMIQSKSNNNACSVIDMDSIDKSKYVVTNYGDITVVGK